jgi:hypothetical protein
MAEEVAEQSEETTDSIWAKLGITDPDEQYAEEETEAEAEAEKEDKLAKKLTSRIDNLEKKFRQDRLQQAQAKFLEGCDPLERDLFKTIAGDVKDPETLDHAITLVKARSDEMRKRIEDAEKEARDQVQRSWGVANPGRAAQPSEDEAKRQSEAIAGGDTRAGFAAIMDGDSIMAGRF